MSARLEVRELVAGFGEKEILSRVTLRVDSGEVLGLLGANGSGKTTLLNCVSGHIAVRSGSIAIDGHSIAQLGPRQRARRVSVVPQTYDLPPGFTVRELVSMGRHPHVGFFAAPTQQDEEAVGEALRALALDAAADTSVERLSGGERQMVVLAMALAQEAQLLLLDEPTAHLDVRHQARIMETIRSVSRRSGLATLAVLHDINLARRYCDRVVLLSAGRLAADGPPREVLSAVALGSCFGVTPSFFDEFYSDTVEPAPTPARGR